MQCVIFSHINLLWHQVGRNESLRQTIGLKIWLITLDCVMMVKILI